MEAVNDHLSGISQLADTIYQKAKKTTMKPYWVEGADKQPFLIDPVSIKFHHLMNKSKKKQGFVDFYKKPVKPSPLDPKKYKAKAKKNKRDKRPIFPSCS